MTQRTAQSIMNRGPREIAEDARAAEAKRLLTAIYEFWADGGTLLSPHAQLPESDFSIFNLIGTFLGKRRSIKPQAIHQHDEDLSQWENEGGRP